MPSVLAPLPVARVPTPVTPVAGVRGLWVKDEGRAGSPYGGNKVRKLRWILADVIARGHRSVVTFGGVGSHHVLATAMFGAEYGIATHALLFAQPSTAHVRANAARIAAYTASWAPLFDPLKASAALAALYARLDPGRRPYRVAVGGSSVVGTLGWVEAGLELANQVAAGELPPPQRVYAAVGTGGTVAGLQVGLALGGLRTEVVGVRVVTYVAANEVRLAALARQVRRRWSALHPTADIPPLGPLRLVHHWLAGGYGAVQPRVLAAARRAHDAGLGLETTYTAKAFGACLEERARDPVDAVFVQTASTVPLPAPPPVPAAMEALLTGPQPIGG